jgi:hypothetical protein
MIVAVLRRGIVVVAVVASAIIAGTVWLFNRSDNSGYATPEEAVLQTCHADPANPPNNFVVAPGASSTVMAVQINTAVVSWTARGESPDPSETALVQRADSKWHVVTCRMRFTLHGR